MGDDVLAALKRHRQFDHDLASAERNHRGRRAPVMKLATHRVFALRPRNDAASAAQKLVHCGHAANRRRSCRAPEADLDY